MDTQKSKSKQSNLFRLKPKSASSKISGGILSKGRFLLGRAETCDLIVDFNSVSAVHAVIEIFEDKAKIYDMNSTNGTYVNGERTLVKEIRLKDTFALADVEFSFVAYNSEDSLPPVLETLEPSKISAVNKLPPVAPTLSGEPVPHLVYPLALDPKADKSEYIFEDADMVFPIFKYDIAKTAVEVIILHNDRIFSVDYLPQEDGVYYLSGVFQNVSDIEFPYLGIAEKIPFVEVHGTRSSVQKIFGYEIIHFSDNEKKNVNQTSGSIDLTNQDIVRFIKDKIQIFVRCVDAPPQVAHAPLIKRDPDFRKYLTILLLLVFLLCATFPFIEIEKPKEDEKAPERMATILYKQKLTVAKNRAVEKTPDAPKRVQKAPPKVSVSAEKPKPNQLEIKKPDVLTTKNQNSKPDPGDKKAPFKQVVKQGEVKPTPMPSANSAAAKGPTKSMTTKSANSFAKFETKSKGPVDVYKSSDFASSVSSLVAKGGSLSGVTTKSVSGSSTGFGGGTITGIGSGTSDLKRANVGANTGSLVGTNTGVLGTSKGAEGLSSKKAVYTAGIPSETVVLGSMDPDVIRRILMDHLPQFRHCYQSELEKTGQELKGVIKLDFAIGASGHVTNAGVEASDLPTPVRKCVVGVLRGIQFPEPMGGGTVEVKQPMNFYPRNL